MKKLIGKVVITYVVLVLIFITLLLMVSVIPRRMIKSNVGKSLEILNKEGETFTLNSYESFIRVDNSTDAIMINIAYSVDDNDNFRSIILNKRNFVPNSNQRYIDEDVGNLKHETVGFAMVEELDNTYHEREISARSYAKYWHGYLVLLRPLLLFLNITQIRYLFFAILAVTFIVLMYEVSKVVSKKRFIFFLLGTIAIDLLVFMHIVQGIFPIFLGMLFSIFVAKYKEMSREKFLLLMFILGGLTAYFDFFTTPLVAGLLPVIVKNLINEEKNNEKKVIDLFKEYFFDMLFFTIGYALLWATKWILTDIIFHTKVIEKALQEVQVRTTQRFGLFHPLVVNVSYSINMYTVILLVLFEGLFLYKIFKTKKLGKKSEIPYYLCILTVIVYYLIVSQHTIQHNFFTYKAVDVIYICLMLLC